MTDTVRLGLVSETVLDGPAWADQARRIEESGINSLLIRDQFSAAAFGQQLAQFSALAAAAAVTTRLTVGTLVLSNDFRHPAIVAHETAEYQAAGIPSPPRLSASTGSTSRLRL